MVPDIPVLIPAYNPPPQLVTFVEELLNQVTSSVVVVNDGSAPEFQEVFDRVRLLPGVIYLTHSVNLGKGQALKTGLSFIYQKFSNIKGVVTADADGQHTVQDVLRIKNKLISAPDSLVLGSRSFDQKMPWRSWFGNTLTRLIFGWLTGRHLQDTQTGLRGISWRLISNILALEGKAYDYEMNVLLAASRSGVPVIEEPISTIYLFQNRASHFRPLVDSMRIYWVLLRYVASSLIAALVDFFFFSMMIRWLPNITLCMLISRYVIGALVNFTINRAAVFRYRPQVWQTLGKYYLIATVSGLLASAIVIILVRQMHLSIMVSKIIAETVLFPLGFILQRNWVFTNRKLIH